MYIYTYICIFRSLFDVKSIQLRKTTRITIWDKHIHKMLTASAIGSPLGQCTSNAASVTLVRHRVNLNLRATCAIEVVLAHDLK